ncbi:AraC family transcriptional regulator [Paenibacillus sp. 598K]|uniref:AraC family transcriptional regulator n=1 Tax=Paenibacillus sp. 598K TaxID=1117987 RepID=UPI000FF9FBA5|nr:helix-turn-helix domain-containing protein [Paenibacillus sp. 598K]GBF71900.1 AraC family transcriptional regulator [Paenibacillus sp. 598K]
MRAKLRTRKYLQKLLLTIVSLVTVFLLSATGTVFYYADQIVKRTQQEANEKVLAQISYNLQYMNESIKTLATSIYFDNDLSGLFYADNETIEALMKAKKLDKIVSSTSLLHSILIYNQVTDTFYGGGDVSYMSPADEVIEAVKSVIQGDAAGISNMKLVPLYPGGPPTDGSASLFSVFMYDSLDVYRGESMLVLNIKPDWIIDNVQELNGMNHASSSVYIVDANDQPLIVSPDQAIPPFPVDSVRQQANDKPLVYDAVVGEVKYRVTTLPVSDMGWKLVIVDNYAIIMKQVTLLKQICLGVTLLFLVASIAASFILSRRLYKPVDDALELIRGYGAQGGDSLHRDEWGFISAHYSKAMEEIGKVKRDQGQIMKAFYLRRLITNSDSMNEAEWEQTLRDYSCPVDLAKPLQLVAIQLDLPGSRGGELRGSELQLLMFAVGNIAEEILAQRFACCVADTRGERLLLLLNSEGEEQESEQALLELCGQLQDVVSGYYKRSISCAISARFRSYRAISEYHNQVVQQLSYRMVYGYGAMITPAMVASNVGNYDFQLPEELRKKWVNGIQDGNLAQAGEALDQILERLSAYDYDCILQHVLQLLLLLKQTLQQMNQHRMQAYAINDSELSRTVMEQGTLRDVRRVLHTALEAIHRTHAPSTDSKHEMIVEAIKAIVQGSYMDMGLNLAHIADTVRMSENYVGKLFRASQGMSIADYINEVRLEQARLLLEQTDITVNGIMERVGYGNQSYFFRLFKRRFGTTPKEYRFAKSRLFEEQ